MKKNSSNELKVNTILIAISNIGSKAISFILAPLYSFYLTTKQYGNMDLIVSTVSLLIPIICFDIFEATFRYANDRRYDDKKVFSSSIAVFLFGMSVSILITAVLFLKYNCDFIIIYINLFTILDAFNSILAQFIRGKNLIRKFAFSGVVCSVSLLIFNFIFLCLFKLQLKGWLFSFFISKLFLLIYLILNVRFRKLFRFKYISFSYIKILIRLCIPLIPTATMWWVMNVSDRYLISYFLGVSATGIYSVANKIPTILSVFENVFYQAWQTSAIKFMNAKNRDIIFSNVFNNYFEVMVVGVSGVLVIGEFIIKVLFEKSYYPAWECMGLLILAVLFHALSGNLGSLYLIFKSTNGALYSSLIGAFVNIILNIILIPHMGLWGAALTTCLGYMVTLIYRFFDVKKYVSISLDKKKFSLLLFMLLIQVVLYHINNEFSFGLRILIFSYLLVSKRKLICSLLRR